MKRLLLILVAVSAVGLASYQLVSKQQSDAKDPVARGTSVTPPTPELKYDHTLPLGVIEALPSIVAVQRLTSSSRAVTTNGLDASGVFIDDKTILTAGHVVTDKGQLVCKDTRVMQNSSQDKDGRAVKRAAATDNNVTKQDLAILEVNTDKRLKQPVSVSATSAKKGDTVYFVNYQALADDTRRDLSSPAVFSGMVASVESGSYRIVANIDKNRGQDALLRQGGSGGAILDAQGQLLAISVTIDSLTATHSAGSLAQRFGVTLPAGSYQLTRGQMITPERITELRRSLNRC